MRRYFFISGVLILSIIAVALNFAGRTFKDLRANAAASWTSITIESGFAVSSTRTIYNSTLGEFATVYIGADGQNIKFAKSTSGSLWSSPVTVTSSPVNTFSTDSTFFTTSTDGLYAIWAPRAATNRIFSTSTDGTAWSNFAFITPEDHIQSGQIQYKDGNPMIVGMVDVGATNILEFASSTNGGTSFTSSSIATGFSSSIQSDFSVRGQSLAAVYGIMDNVTYIATSTNNGASWYTYSITGTAGTLHVRPKIRIDRNGEMWVAYVFSNDQTCSSACRVRLVHFDWIAWDIEDIDTVGGTSGISPEIDLVFTSNNTPVVVYYNKTTDKVRYAVRDFGVSGCSGTSAAKYTCGDVASSIGGQPAISAAAYDTRVVVNYQTQPSQTVKAAYADIGTSELPQSSTETTVGSGRFARTPPRIQPPLGECEETGGVFINNNASITTSTQVFVSANAQNISEISLSLDPNFENAIWQAHKDRISFTLKPIRGPQCVYAKFTNSTGAVSSVYSDWIMYDPEYIAPVAQPVQKLQPEQEQQAQPIQSPTEVKAEPVQAQAPALSPKAESSALLSPLLKILERYSCPLRPSPFTLGGEIVRVKKTGALYLLLKNGSVRYACPVPSKIVTATWGVQKFKDIKSLEPNTIILNPLPYRPGSVVEDTKTKIRYFVNPTGQLHKFPGTKQLTTLGYSATRIWKDTGSALAAYGKSATLIRTDIHPDGTLFKDSASPSGYWLLNERKLHEISKDTLIAGGDTPKRAIILQKSEQYTVGEQY